MVEKGKEKACRDHAGEEHTERWTPVAAAADAAGRTAKSAAAAAAARVNGQQP